MPNVVDTKYGQLEFTPTCATHILISCSEFVVRGVVYHISGHFCWDAESKLWSLNTKYGELYIGRHSKDPNWLKGPSESARQAIASILQVQGANWAAQNISIIETAGRQARQDEINGIEEEIREAEAKLIKLKAKLQERLGQP